MLPATPSKTILHRLRYAVFRAICRVGPKVKDVYTIEKRSDTPLAADLRVARNDAGRRHQFNEQVTKLQAKKIIVPSATVVISSYDRTDGSGYVAIHLSCSLASSGWKVLLVDVCGGLVAPAGVAYYKANEVMEDGIIIRGALSEKLAAWHRCYDLILIVNQPVDESANALVYMSLATTNLFVLDARWTPASRIREADLLGDCFSLPNRYYILYRG